MGCCVSAPKPLCRNNCGRQISSYGQQGLCSKCYAIQMSQMPAMAPPGYPGQPVMMGPPMYPPQQPGMFYPGPGGPAYGQPMQPVAAMPAMPAVVGCPRCGAQLQFPPGMMNARCPRCSTVLGLSTGGGGQTIVIVRDGYDGGGMGVGSAMLATGLGVAGGMMLGAAMADAFDHGDGGWDGGDGGFDGGDGGFD